MRLWYYKIYWVCETGNLIVTSSIYVENRTPVEIVTGETPNITEYFDFRFHYWVTSNSNSVLGSS